MRLNFDTAAGGFDLALTATGDFDAGVGNGGALESAVWVSIFTDALAEPGDLTVDLGTDRRGWWADAGRSAAESMGSLLWLHLREKRSETARLAIETAAWTAVQWLVDDGVASAVEVEAVFLDSPRDALRLTVFLTEPNGVRRDWSVDLLWSGVARR